MANRPVYVAKASYPYVLQENMDFQFYPGFSLKQKQLSIESLHKSYLDKYPNKSVLEISSKSKDELGIKLSAFNLLITTTKNNRSFSVECAFQSSKVFENGGPYTDLLRKSSREAKKDPRVC